MPAMILAVDVGGSKTLVGLFERNAPRPRLRNSHAVRTLDFDGIAPLLRSFLGPHPDVAIDTVSLGVAGPILAGEATLTNVPWRVRIADVTSATGVADVRLLNDLEAMAYGVPVLAPGELHTLQAGAPGADGNAGLIAAGTGLGEAVLHRVDGRMIPVPSEAGHADFAARTDDEIVLLQRLRDRFGRVDVEQVVSGPGLVNLAEFTHGGGTCETAGTFASSGDGAESIATAAAQRRCPSCARAMTMFVSAYGAEAGNLALRAVATAGLYVGGGIAPKNLEVLAQGAFMAAFLDKPPMRPLLERVPVHVILNEQTALLGAAVAALTPPRR